MSDSQTHIIFNTWYYLIMIKYCLIFQELLSCWGERELFIGYISWISYCWVNSLTLAWLHPKTLCSKQGSSQISLGFHFKLLVWELEAFWKVSLESLTKKIKKYKLAHMRAVETSGISVNSPHELNQSLPVYFYTELVYNISHEIGSPAGLFNGSRCRGSWDNDLLWS